MKIKLNANKTRIEGRIERLAIQRSDGTLRDVKLLNIHNTIVNTGLDNILSIGGFDEDGYSSSTLAGSNNNHFDYDGSLWVRMTWFMQIGSGVSPDGTTHYDWTELLDPYTNSDSQSYSSSHYIPTTKDLSIRGTTHEAYSTTDIHSTSRITSNSVKVSETVEVKEVGFFVGVNNTFNNAWATQSFNVGDMFSRIELGEHAVTLYAGERLVVTYAITEYADPLYKTIDDLGFVDANGNPLVISAGGELYRYGAIARTAMCDGVYIVQSAGNNTMPGALHCVDPTSDIGYAIPVMCGNETGSSVVDVDHYERTQTQSGNRSAVYNRMPYVTPHAFESYYHYFTVHNPLLLGILTTLPNDTSTESSMNKYNVLDQYGFPEINQHVRHYGTLTARFVGRTPSGGLRPSNSPKSSTDLIPNYVWCNIASNSYTSESTAAPGYPIISKYKRGDYYRDIEWIVPAYSPYRGTAERYSPSSIAADNVEDIYWIYVRGMWYKLGYFTESGNINSFVQHPITKKAGQVMRIFTRDTVARRLSTD